jgi:hypothetical protein
LRFSVEYGGSEMQTSRADYYRRQADICFRLSLAASDDEISVHLIALAQRYKAKAEALERERPPPEVIAQTLSERR